jgi:hypothetical protein
MRDCSPIVLALLMALTSLPLTTAPAFARGGSDAAEAAKAAKRDFHERNSPGGSGAGPATATRRVGAPPTRTLTAEVAEVGDDGTVVLIAEDDGLRVTVPPGVGIDAKVKNRRHFDGRKKIGWDELAPGYRLKITFRTDSGELLKAKVLEVTAGKRPAPG